MKKKIILMLMIGAFLQAGGCLIWTGQAALTSLNMGLILDCDNGFFDFSSILIDCP